MDWIEHLELRKTGSHINVKLSVKCGKDRVILALSGSDFINRPDKAWMWMLLSIYGVDSCLRHHKKVTQSTMFPVSGVESAFLPVTDNETGNFYQNAWHYHYHNQLQSPYAMFGNVPGTSGLFVNNNLWPPAHEHQFRATYPGVGVTRFPQGIPNENTLFDIHADPLSYRTCTTSEQHEPASEIKSEVRDDIAYQDFSHSVNSSMEDNVKREKEKGYSNLQENEAKGLTSSELYRQVTKCSFCDTTFSDIAALQDHLPTHNDLNDTENTIIIDRRQEHDQADQDRPFFCTLCHCKFSCATDLRIHLFSHSKKVPTCEVCNRTFRFRKGLKKHMVLHKKLPTSKDSNPFKTANKPIYSKPEAMAAICSFCNKTFSDIDALQEHLPTHNDINNLENITERRQEPGQADQDNLFLCNTCPCKFSTATDLRIHLFFHSGKTPTCEVCNRTFRRRKGLTSHMMVHEKIRNFKCNICEMEFPRNYILKRHIVLSHAGEPLKCDECNSAFRHPERLAKHKRLAHPRRDDMKCVKCSEQFTSLKDLSIHKLIHLKETPVICDTAFAKKKDLTRHKATYHGKGSKELYKCSTCQRTFTRLNNLILHKKLHGDNKTRAKLRCENCNKIFTKEAHLRLHTPRCQEKMRLQLCHICGQFYSNKTLNYHLNSHSDINSYICETCKEILPNQTSLKIHALRHKGISTPSCDKCGLEFLSASALKTHVDRHRGVKRHQCKECGKKYSSEFILKTHMNKHTGARPYQCKLCQRSFPSGQGKLRHEKLHEKGFQRIRK